MRSQKSIVAVLAASFCFMTGFAGCGEEAKVEKKETVTSPTGTTTTETTQKINSTGSNPPANSAGQSVPPKE